MQHRLSNVILSIALLSTCTSALAQSGVGATAATSGDQFLQKQIVRDNIAAGAHTNPNSMIFGVPLPAGDLKGDYYLTSDFREGRFELSTSSKLYEDFQIRYDLRSNLIEINYDDGIRGLDGNKVKYFEMLSASGFKKYVNSNQVEGSGEDLPANMFLEVLADEKIPLYRYERVSIKKANYNVAMNVGSRDDEIIKTPVYLTVVDGKVTELRKGKKSELFTLLPSREAELRAFAKKEKIKLKDEEDFIRMIQKLNSF